MNEAIAPLLSRFLRKVELVAHKANKERVIKIDFIIYYYHSKQEKYIGLKIHKGYIKNKKVVFKERIKLYLNKNYSITQLYSIALT